MGVFWAQLKGKVIVWEEFREPCNKGDFWVDFYNGLRFFDLGGLGVHGSLTVFEPNFILTFMLLGSGIISSKNIGMHSASFHSDQRYSWGGVPKILAECVVLCPPEN